MKMFNLDLQQQLREEREGLFKALKSEDKAVQEKGFNNFAQGLQNIVMEAAENYIAEAKMSNDDEQVLFSRGKIRALTSAERKFFNAAVAQQSLENLSEVFPETIIDTIFDNLTEEHPILSRVDTKTTAGLLEFLYADPTKSMAYWDSIPADIRQLVLAGFKVIKLSSSKLSAFVPVKKEFFNLGPAWLANYVLTLLEEIMTATLEIAIVDGDGDRKPIGMTRKLSGAVDGVFPKKDTIAVKDLTPETLGGVRAALAKAKTDNGQISVLVNPMTYWAKMFAKLAKRSEITGEWLPPILPGGEEIVMSHAVPEDTLIFGVLKNYLLAVSGQVKIDEYKETLAIEDMDLYIAKFTGTGTPKNKDAFFIVDISKMGGANIPALADEVDIPNPEPITELSAKSKKEKQQRDQSPQV